MISATIADIDLPPEWSVVPLGEAASLTLGRTPSRRSSVYWQSGTVPWVAIADLNNGLVTSTAEHVSDPAFQEVFKGKLVPAGSLLLSFKLTIGKVGILGMDAQHNEAIVSLSPVDDLADRDFLFYLLQRYNYDSYLGTYVKGKTLNKRKLLQLPIPLPPLPEQRAIARVLRTVQQAIEATDAVIAAAEALKKSLMEYLFTYGPVPVDEVGEVELKETEIGPMPTDWVLSQVRQFGCVVTGSTPPTARDDYWNGDVPFVTPPDLMTPRVRAASRHITQAGLEVARPVPRGTVLVSCIGNIGRVAVVDMPLVVTNQQINAVVPDTSCVDSDYLAYALVRMSPHLKNAASITTVPILSKSNFQAQLVPSPPLPVQAAIGRSLRVLESKREIELRGRSALSDLFESLLHDLVTGSLRVPAFEPGMAEAEA